MLEKLILLALAYIITSKSMKENTNILLIITSFIITSFFLTACSSTQTTGYSGSNPSEIVDIYTGSRNQLDLVIASEPIEYTIDISTPEGKSKLNNLTLQQAEGLVIREAVMKNKCAKLVDPQFTNLMKGKHVLRVTVYGFPAKYKNQ